MGCDCDLLYFSVLKFLLYIFSDDDMKMTAFLYFVQYNDCTLVSHRIDL